jgi:formate hydrogenlyase transcriptional activator
MGLLILTHAYVRIYSTKKENSKIQLLCRAPVRKDGSRFWANVVITAPRDPAGNLEGFCKVTRDFTARKQAEEALLLEITNVLVSNLDIAKLLSAISAGLQQVVRHDYASVALYDPALNKLRLHMLNSAAGVEVSPSETIIPLEGTPSGLCFVRSASRPRPSR